MHEQRLAAARACRRLITHPAFIRSQRIAAYLACQGEIDPSPLIHACWQYGKSVFLPILDPLGHNRLIFSRYRPDQPLALNRFGIPEPLCGPRDRADTWTLDLVITPLLGFDSNGHRIGMGGGYYDRTFEFLNRRLGTRKPIMVGMAHDCQEIAPFNPQNWDVGMDYILTGTRLLKTTEGRTSAS
jgi:5-formyltetrahydrofolate cyclo-ligase